MRSVVIVGAGSFGGEMAWVLRRLADSDGSLRTIGFCDDAAAAGGTAHGLPLLGTVEEAARASGKDIFFHVAVGDNLARRQLAARAMAAGWQPLTVIDPAAVIAENAVIGAGCYIGAHAVVSSRARLGEFVIVNFHASIGHDAVVDAGAHVSPGARVSGGCRLGALVLLGSNAVVLPGVLVGDKATVGPNTVALRDVAAGTTLARPR